MSGTERVLFVHAHPDDETIETGGTLATLIDRGAHVTVITCTRGERGEVIGETPNAPIHSPETLAVLREAELRDAMRILGVADHRFLGEAGARWSGRAPRTYADSGMKWGLRGAEPTGEFDPATLTGAEFGDVSADIAAVILDVKPDVVVSYDDHGGYGHPDHIRAGQAARRAAEVYGVAYYSIDSAASDAEQAGDVTRDITVDIAPVLGRKRAALREYRSQLSLGDDDLMTYPGGQTRRLTAVETFSRIRGESDDVVPFAEQHIAARIFALTVAFIIGIVVGALFSVYCLSTITILGQPIWGGVIVGGLVVAAILVGFRLAFGTRMVALAAAVGMIVIVGLFTVASSGGSVIVPTIATNGAVNGAGTTWAILPTLIAFVVVAWPGKRRPAIGKIEAR
jgi:N-acetyl-1-D-myo-inositol-2-amino-2-deoxy-alpha-D-glucopyranoside deacetylase